MALPSRKAGSQLPVMQVTYNRRDLTTPDFSSGYTLTGTIRNMATRTETAITGTLTITGVNTFNWLPSAADVATAGNYLVEFTFTNGSGESEISFSEPWSLKSADG